MNLKIDIMNDLICESFTADAIRKIEDIQNDIETAIHYCTDEDYKSHLNGIIDDLNKVIEKLY